MTVIKPGVQVFETGFSAPVMAQHFMRPLFFYYFTNGSY